VTSTAKAGRRLANFGLSSTAAGPSAPVGGQALRASGGRDRPGGRAGELRPAAPELDGNVRRFVFSKDLPRQSRGRRRCGFTCAGTRLDAPTRNARRSARRNGLSRRYFIVTSKAGAESHSALGVARLSWLISADRYIMAMR